MSIFKFKRYDLHTRIEVTEDGEYKHHVIDDDWKRFDTCIDITQVRIHSFMEDVLFDSEKNPTSCIKIIFTDGTYYFSPHSLELFERKYKDEYLEELKKATD